MPRNLLEELPPIDEIELRWVLQEEVARPQIANAKNLVYSGPRGVILSLSYREGRLLRMEPGPAFSAAALRRLRRAIEEKVVKSTPRVARTILFCSRPVEGYFRDTGESIQILPAPGSAPRPSQMTGDWPFILEFRVAWSIDVGLTNQRRGRGSVEWALLLNAVLRRSIEPSDSARQPSVWVTPLSGPNMFGPSLIGRRGYWLPGFEPYADDFTPIGTPIHLVADPDYYAADGWKHDATLMHDLLVVPDSLSDVVTKFQSLGVSDRRKFLRAAFWYSASRRAWDFNASSWFTSMVAAIETLAPGAKERCPRCKTMIGVSASFREFVRQSSPTSSPEARKVVYDLRSSIVHGSRLLQLDETSWDFSLHSTWIEEQEARDNLSNMARAVLVNWLKAH